MDMGQVSEAWDWTKKIAGVFFTVCLCLYLIRCIVGVHVLSIEEFELFFNKLARCIFC